jgi:RNA polymerase primary sigma factor
VRSVLPMTETADGFARFLAGIADTPLLTADEELSLARRVERGDLAAKERIVQANLRLVVHVARRYVRDDHGLSLPDLVQEGTLGLVRAVEKFDWRRGHRFSTYATIWIRQSIGRAISDKGRSIRLPVHVGQRLSVLNREERRLTGALGRAPTVAELAEALGRPPEQVLHDRELGRMTVSLDEPLGEGADAVLADLIADDAEAGPDVHAEMLLMRAALARALASLPPRERAVLELRYGLGSDGAATPAETADRLRLRPQQVRRLEELALRRLRAAPETGALREPSPTPRR